MVHQFTRLIRPISIGLMTDKLMATTFRIPNLTEKTLKVY